MVPWIIGLASYLTVGLVLVFVGPAARQRRREQEIFGWQGHAQLRWKLMIFSYALAIGIIFLWPVLIVSAARTEAARKADLDLFGLRPVPPSAALDRWISDIQNRYSSSLPFEDYREIVSKLPWTDRKHFDNRLAQLNYAVTGCATDPQGQDIAVSVPVLRIGIPFALTSVPKQSWFAAGAAQMRAKRNIARSAPSGRFISASTEPR